MEHLIDSVVPTDMYFPLDIPEAGAKAVCFSDVRITRIRQFSRQKDQPIANIQSKTKVNIY